MTSTTLPVAAARPTTTHPRRALAVEPRTAVREAVMFLGITYGAATAVAVALPGTRANPGPVSLLTLILPALVVGGIRLTARLRGGPANPYPLGLRRLGLRSWPTAIALPTVTIAVSFALAAAIGVVSFDRLLDYVVGAPANLVMMTLVLFGEEIGWRSYLLPRVVTVMPPRRATVVTGLCHALFHVPLLTLTVAYDSDGSRWIVVPGVVAVITAGGVLFGWLRLHSMSLWPVAIAHAAVNTSLIEAPFLMSRDASLAAYLTGEGGLFTMITVGVLAAAMLAFGDWCAAEDAAEALSR